MITDYKSTLSFVFQASKSSGVITEYNKSSQELAGKLGSIIDNFAGQSQAILDNADTSQKSLKTAKLVQDSLYSRFNEVKFSFSREKEI